MKDIKLDFVNKKLLNETIDNQYRIAQQIKVTVRSWRGDFFLNSGFGVNYNVCWHDPLLMKAYLTQQIKNVPNVLGVNSVSIKKSKTDDNKTCFLFNATVILESGSIDISEIIEGV